jgi:tetratricopeptide (TPR) repeat protein
VLSLAIAMAIFFLLWATFHELEGETSVIFAGMGSSIVLASAVFLREVILRRARQRYQRSARQLDYNLESFPRSSNSDSEIFKLSVKRNAFLVEQVKRKSNAASVLGHLPDGHWEVFELCNEYLLLNENQLHSVGVGSPRLAALRRGREIVEKLHKFHLLNWVEIETRLLTEAANKQVELSDKIELSQRAVTAINSALEFYPEDIRLRESKDVLDEFVGSIRISYWIEQAEREAFKENYQEAISLYRDALFYLARENVHNVEKSLIAERINSEIERIRNLKSDILQKVKVSRDIKKVKTNKND